MKIVIFILNLPWTIIGIILALLSLPKKVATNKIPFAFVFKIRSFWWFQWLPNSKGTRGMAIGNVVLLGPKELPKDKEHELIHTEQIEREPFVHIFLYYIEMIKHGYKDNKYEKEAYGRAGNLYIEQNKTA